MYDVAALGELLIDFTCLTTDADGYPTMAAHPGGAPANYLAALTKFGAKTAMIGKVGNDAFGRLLIKTLKGAGIGTHGMLVSDDVAVRVTPFDMDENGRRTAKVLERAFASAIERSGVKTLGRPLLKNACVDGDACFYMHFDPALETGQAVKGDISVDLIDSVNICFGNPACDEVQHQPYIIIAMRRDVDEVRREARENGVSDDEIEAIRAYMTETGKFPSAVAEG